MVHRHSISSSAQRGRRNRSDVHYVTLSRMRLLSPLFGVCLLNLSAAAFGQPLSFGVIGGASLTQDFEDRTVGEVKAYSTPKRWIVGAMAEVHLPLHLSVEVDGLYHELKFTNAFVEPNGTLNSVSPAPVVTWEIPVLVKYRFLMPVVRPFVEAGPCFRAAGNLNGASPSDHGFTLGGGAELRLWKLKIAPQIRYLRWAVDSNVGPVAPFTAPNQAEFLLAIFF